MWYDNTKTGWTAENWLSEHSADEAVVRAVAEHLIRRKALLIKRKDLEPRVVSDLVDGVVYEMSTKFGNLSEIRRHAKGDSLLPIVQQYIPDDF